jgi:hypothetical protein
MKLKGYVKELGLTSACSEGHSFETIAEPIAKLRDIYPTAGANSLRVYMRTVMCGLRIAGVTNLSTSVRPKVFA